MIQVTPLIADRLAKRKSRALTAIGHGILYKLGSGGLFPADPLPTRDGLCDCSGFALAWVQSISRQQEDKGKPWSASMPWINTDAAYHDARFTNDVFVHLSEPVPGCAMVYPSENGIPGHCCIVYSWNGTTLIGIDCHGGIQGHTVAAIEQHDLTYFISKGIPIALKEDLS